MRQASAAGNISGARARPKGGGSGRRSGVPTEEANKAIFRRYVEEVFNHGNLELADEIFDRYIAHQPDGEARCSASHDFVRSSRSTVGSDR
jgi:hypothetical protein